MRLKSLTVNFFNDNFTSSLLSKLITLKHILKHLTTVAR